MLKTLLKMKPAARSTLLLFLFIAGLSGQTLADSVSSAPEARASNSDSTKTDPSFSLEKAKHRFSWLALNADLRLREEYYNNLDTLNGNLPNHEYNYQRYRVRFGIAVRPFKDLDFVARAMTERRSYLKPDSMEGFRPDEFLFDNLYVAWRNVFALPVKITVGRQDMRIGSGWLLNDGTPGDGSRTSFFDAARLTVDWKSANTTLDLVEIMQPVHGNTWLPIFHDLKKGLTEQNENGFVANLSNRSITGTQIDGYFIYKHNSKVSSNGDQGGIYAAGGAVERQFAPRWKLRVEMAPEWGTKNGKNFRAFGANSRLTCSIRDNQKIRIGFEYLSGDDPSSQNTNEAFDILWGRWPQWSDLYSLTMVREKRISDWNNLQRLDVGWTINPVKNLEVTADYMPMFAPQNPNADKTGFSGRGHFRGSLATVVLHYAFGKHIHSKLQNEFFFPGSYYSPEHRSFANFMRAEMNFSW